MIQPLVPKRKIKQHVSRLSGDRPFSVPWHIYLLANYSNSNTSASHYNILSMPNERYSPSSLEKQRLYSIKYMALQVKAINKDATGTEIENTRLEAKRHVLFFYLSC